MISDSEQSLSGGCCPAISVRTRLLDRTSPSWYKMRQFSDRTAHIDPLRGSWSCTKQPLDSWTRKTRRFLYRAGSPFSGGRGVVFPCGPSIAELDHTCDREGMRGPSCRVLQVRQQSCFAWGTWLPAPHRPVSCKFRIVRTLRSRVGRSQRRG